MSRWRTGPICLPVCLATSAFVSSSRLRQFASVACRHDMRQTQPSNTAVVHPRATRHTPHVSVAPSVRGNVKKYKRHVSKRMPSNLTCRLLVLNTPFGGWQISQFAAITAYCRILPPDDNLSQVTTDLRQIQLDHHGGILPSIFGSLTVQHHHQRATVAQAPRCQNGSNKITCNTTANLQTTRNIYVNFIKISLSL
jgi:hypothetical protein